MHPAAVLPVLATLLSLGPKWQAGEPITRHLSLGVSLFSEQGFGIAVRGRHDAFAVEASGAASPWIFFVPEGCGRVKLGVDPRVTLSALSFFADETDFFQPAVRIGGTWDGLSGFGVLAGFNAELSFSKLVALQAGVGVKVFPKAEARIESKLEALCEEDVDRPFPLLSVVQGYFGVTLLFYLL